MNQVIREIKKHLQIYLLFVKNCFITEMQYRFNFFMGIVLDGIFFFNKIIYAIIIYKTGVTINGLSPDAILLFVGTYSIIQGLYTTFFIVNFNYTLPCSIREGKLDIYMTKPISLQFLISTRYVEFSTMIPDLIGGIILVVIAWSRLGIVFNLVNVLGYGLILIVGLIIAYAIFFSIQLLSFYIINMNAISEISGELFILNNMPMKIYSKSIQFIGTFVLPIFLILNYAPMFLLEKLNLFNIAWLIFVVVILMFLSRYLWKIVIKNYTSASS